MSKPLPSQTTFAPLSPPWSLTSLDANFTNVWSAIDDIGTYSNVFADTGAVNAMTVTVTAPLTFALVDGVTLDVNVGHTTTVTNPTLNVASTGAKTIVNADNTALAVGQLVLGTRVRMLYDAANTVWRVTSQTNGVPVLNGPLVVNAPASGVTAQIGSSGSTAPVMQAWGPVALAQVDLTADKSTFTGTLTGMTAGTTGTVTWLRVGGLCIVYVSAAILGTSNAVTMTMTGLPAVIQPANTQQGMCVVQNNATNSHGTFSVTGGTITFGIGTVSGSFIVVNNAGFTNSGTKGVAVGWTIAYALT